MMPIKSQPGKTSWPVTIAGEPQDDRGLFMWPEVKQNPSTYSGAYYSLTVFRIGSVQLKLLIFILNRAEGREMTCCLSFLC